MKKNETELLNLITAIQSQLVALDKKVDGLINRSLSVTKPSPVPTPNFPPPVAKPHFNEHHKGRMMYKAICADCKKECSIPFKPSGDRPVYCQDCFSRRKVISLSKIGIDDKPKIEVPEQPPVKKKKAVAVKKPVVKRKTAPKKK